MFGLVDIIIILFLAMGVVVGFKRGVFKSAVMFLGTILVLVLAFYLKNPVSEIMYKNLPFFNLGGAFAGIKVFNIIVYEALAFLIVYAVLMVLLRAIIKLTGLFELLLRFTIVLGIPSKILGGIFGFFEEYVITFLILFLLARLSITAPYVAESNLAQKILKNSPIISDITKDYYQSFEEIYSLKDKYQSTQDKVAYENEALGILLKYKIITPNAAEDLVVRGKLDFEGVEKIIDQYKGE